MAALTTDQLLDDALELLSSCFLRVILAYGAVTPDEKAREIRSIEREMAELKTLRARLKEARS